MSKKFKFNDEEFEGFEMPTPCNHCNTIFELNEGTSFNNIVYCEECGEDLNSMKELEDEIEEINDIIEDAKFTVRENSIELENKKKELNDIKDKFLERI